MKQIVTTQEEEHALVVELMKTHQGFTSQDVYMDQPITLTHRVIETDEDGRTVISRVWEAASPDITTAYPDEIISGTLKATPDAGKGI